MAKIVSSTYGEALFSLALEENRIDAFLEETDLLQKTLALNPEFSEVINHPKITKEEKISMVKAVFEGKLSAEMTGFLILLVQKDRYSEIDGILAYFVSKVKEYKGIGVATVTSATELKAAQKEEVRKALLRTTGYKSMEIEFKTDAQLIGGMIIRIGDRVVDGSVSTKLAGLKKELAAVQVG